MPIRNKPLAPKPLAKPQSPKPIVPLGVAGAGGMNRNYLGSPMLPNAMPVGRINPGTYRTVAPSPIAPIARRPSFSDLLVANLTKVLAATNTASNKWLGGTGGNIKQGIGVIKTKGLW